MWFLSIVDILPVSSSWVSSMTLLSNKVARLGNFSMQTTALKVFFSEFYSFLSEQLFMSLTACHKRKLSQPDELRQ